MSATIAQAAPKTKTSRRSAGCLAYFPAFAKSGRLYLAGPGDDLPGQNGLQRRAGVDGF